MSDTENVLFDKLSELGYPNISKFNPSSFDWLFDIEEALPFLNWFCQTVQPANLLTSSQLNRFKELRNGGTTLLEGKRLTQALGNKPICAVTHAELETEIEELNSYKDHLVLKKQELNKQLNNLNSKQKVIDCSISQYEELKNQAEVDEEKATEEVKFLNVVLNESMEVLEKTAENVVSCLNQPKLLCQSNFDSFISMEEEYTALLAKLANSQFDENVGTMAQNSGVEMCAFLKVRDPNLGELLGLDEKTRLAQNWELNHLKKRLPVVEEDRIVNEVELASLQASIDTSRNMIADISNGRFLSTSSSLRLDIEALERKSASYLKECLSLKNEVSDCIQKSTQMRCSSVIVGDCSLKLLRQHYLIGKQKEFLTFLSQQWAREQLVLLAIRLEGRQIESMLSILKNVTQEIVDGNQHLRTRLDTLQDLIDSEKTLRERNTIPSSDIVAGSLLTLLRANKDAPKMLSNYEELSLAVASLLKEAKSTETAHRAVNQQQNQQLKSLEKMTVSMENLIFGGSLTSITQKVSRCTALERQLLKLDSVRDTVQNRLKPLYRDFKAKQLGIKSDHLTVLERRLWTLFYTDASSMQRKTEALNAKANAS